MDALKSLLCSTLLVLGFQPAYASLGSDESAPQSIDTASLIERDNSAFRKMGTNFAVIVHKNKNGKFVKDCYFDPAANQSSVPRFMSISRSPVSQIPKSLHKCSSQKLGAISTMVAESQRPDYAFLGADDVALAGSLCFGAALGAGIETALTHGNPAVGGSYAAFTAYLANGIGGPLAAGFMAACGAGGTWIVYKLENM